MILPSDSYDKFWNDVVKKNFPAAEFRFKDESWLFKYILKYVFFFKKTFMTRFTTVIGSTIYFPSREWFDKRSAEGLATISAHEMMHMWDKRVGKKFFIDWFSIKYLLPQGLAILSLLTFFAFTNLWFLCCLAFILFLAPWPAGWRAQYEARGYAMTLHFRRIVSDGEYDVQRGINEILPMFTDGSYYWMSWSTRASRRTLTDSYETLTKTHAAFKEVEAWLKTQAP